MVVLYGGCCDKLEISLNLWVGVGFVWGGVGMVLVGDVEMVVEWIDEYCCVGIDIFIMLGYLYLEEVYSFGECVLLLLLLDYLLLQVQFFVNMGLFGEMVGNDYCFVIVFWFVLVIGG